MTFTEAELTEIVQAWSLHTKCERSLAAALLEARQDARRYQAMRARPLAAIDALTNLTIGEMRSARQFDAAIDAAIAEGKAP